VNARTGLCAASISAVLLLAVAGCGGSSSSPSTAAATSASQASSTSDAPSASATTSSQPYEPPQTSFSTPSVDPGTLPQTKTMPTDTDPQFTAGVNALWQGVVDDNPQEALPFFFPKSAYLQVKALSNAGSDYQNRLIGFYDLDVHAAHRLLGSGAKNAKLVGVSVPAKAAEWILPGVETNKLSYYRVYGSRLTYTEGGKTKSFGLFSLISWRGQWYVVHFGPNPRSKPIGVVYQPRG
jgi:hypothetical protein